MVKRVAVIGAGTSGLAAIKACLDEGLEPVCLERTDDIGGLWRYREKVDDAEGCVMKNTCSNTSKEMSAYSDFPPAKEQPNFIPHARFLRYMRDYADHFRLTERIRYNTEVKKVTRADDFADTGRWRVQSFDHKNGTARDEVFDAVMVCSGHHAQKIVPPFPGLQDFQGQVIHTHEFRPSEDLEGKRILVVGLGNSGGDAAVELSRYNQVYLSTRRGTWVVPAIGEKGIPWDLAFNTRYELLLSKLLPATWTLATWTAYLNEHLDHDMMPGFVNDELAFRIASGTVKISDDVKRFTSNGVEFKDGTKENIDAIIMATGYSLQFPFIENEPCIEDGHLRLYKNMFLPDLEHQTIAFISMIHGKGSFVPVAELQSRVATSVFKGNTKLPSHQQMRQEIKAAEEMRAQLYPDSPRHDYEIEYMPYLEDLADMIGCKPNVGRLMLTDPVLGLRVFFGPLLPYQYRLQGPGKWAGARQAILTAMDRVRFPLQTRPLPKTTWTPAGRVMRWFVYPPGTWVVFLHLMLVAMVIYTLIR
ncbi:hypothetical protein BaRGS_00008450 [Batillaria attramentaria]|uniref:Flavin-containing monooxygenase n=1 Tax=Batillaria attramentaria TaxID=370345 RepID=A0ABD0LLK7_9CAEN